MAQLFFCSRKWQEASDNILTHYPSLLQTCVYRRLVVNSTIKPGIARICSDIPESIEGTGRKSEIVPCMICKRSDISVYGGKYFRSRCRNNGVSRWIFGM